MAYNRIQHFKNKNKLEAQQAVENTCTNLYTHIHRYVFTK